MDFNYEEYAEEIGLSAAEQENYYNMKEELQRQINAVIEENQLLRQGNEELMVALEQLRQKKNDILQIYRSTIRRGERLVAAAASARDAREQIEPPTRSRYSRYDYRYGGSILDRRDRDTASASGSGSTSSASAAARWTTRSSSSYLSPSTYSPPASCSCSNPNSFSPYSQEGMYLRAMEYARFSSSNPKYNRSGHSCRLCHNHHHY